jgi:hypothetical protein
MKRKRDAHYAVASRNHAPRGLLQREEKIMPAKKPTKHAKKLIKGKRLEATKPLLKLAGITGESQNGLNLNKIE